MKILQDSLWNNARRPQLVQNTKCAVATTSLRITNNTLSKLINKVSCRDHKKTW